MFGHLRILSYVYSFSKALTSFQAFVLENTFLLRVVKILEGLRLDLLYWLTSGLIEWVRDVVVKSRPVTTLIIAFPQSFLIFKSYWKRQTSLWTLISICWLVGWLVHLIRWVCHNVSKRQGSYNSLMHCTYWSTCAIHNEDFLPGMTICIHNE